MDQQADRCRWMRAASNGDGRRTPLHEAAATGDRERITALIASGAPVDAQDEYGWTPLLEAAARCRRRGVVEALIELGADVDFRGTMQPHVRVQARCAAGVQGLRPLHWLALACGEELMEMVELLLARGADVDARAANGATPLHQAACCGNRRVAELLIEHGAEVDARDADWKTPLHQAAMKGQAELIRLLSSAGAEVEARDLHAWTPLHYAASSSRPDVVALLLELGADAEARDDRGKTPADLKSLFAGGDGLVAGSDHHT